MKLQLVKGRPSDTGGRNAQEIACYDLLDRLGIEFERVDHDAAFTMEACIEIDAVLAPAVICKNLFLCNRQKTQFYLLMIREDKAFKTKDVSKQIGAPRLSFAPEAYLMEYLKLTPGSVSVLGLMNDTQGRVKLLIDKDVLQEEYLGCHPCMNTSSIRFRTKYLTEKILPAIHHEYMTVEIPDNPG